MAQLKLWSLSRRWDSDWDDLEAYIAAAETEREAREMAPCKSECDHRDRDSTEPCRWLDPDFADCALVGTADPVLPAGVVLASTR